MDNKHIDNEIYIGNEIYYTYDTLFGKITIESNGDAITGLKTESFATPSGRKEASTLTDITAKQLEEYFAGKRKRFELPIHTTGTDFQRAVWKALLEIPYGKTKTYKHVAEMIGNPKACRAVGLANNKNPIWVIIPCHRVIGADGSLTGYGGGLNMKKKLLALEKR